MRYRKNHWKLKLYNGMEKNNGILIIVTDYARYIVNIKDYIIKGINNELYVCKNDTFKIAYELVEENGYRNGEKHWN